MEFLVADAERLFAEGGKVKNLSFWGYKIMTRSTLASFQVPPLFPRTVQTPPTNSISGEGYVDYCTWHRYSDFEWFVSQLSHHFPGYVFPPIPDKDSDGTRDKLSDLFTSADSSEHSRDNDLVQKRIRHLQLFFDVLQQLTITHESEIVKAFTTMEEPEWLVYKERVTAAQKGKGWEALKSKGLGLISRLGSIGDKKPVAFPEGHPVANMKAKMLDEGNSLRAAAMHMLYLKKYAHYSPELEAETGDDAAKKIHADGTTTVQVLPQTLVYNGHFVSEVNDRVKQGVVRHVEGSSAWVDWGTGAALSRIPVSQLCFPPSGIADPAMFAARELASQVDSFCTYLSMRPEARQLERLVDILYFWAKHCLQAVVYIDSLQEALEQLTIAEKDLSKMKDSADKVATAARTATMRERYEAGVSVLQQTGYPFLRQHLKKALLDATHLFGGLSVSFLCDDEWETRLQRADVALPLLFEPPQEVLDTLTQEAKASLYVDQQPQAQQQQQYSTTWVAQPPPQAPPQQQQQQQQNSTTWVAQPYPPSPVTPPSPTPSPVVRHQDPTPTLSASAPPEDDVPPPLPESSAPQPQQQQHPAAVEHDWETTKPRTRSWEPEQEASSLEPPPPPPSHEA